MSPLEVIIQAEIRQKGSMAFARFMELALYHPEWGYYAKVGSEEKVGKGGDFVTSVSVGSLFGRLLAYQFVRWWEQKARPCPFYILEFGGLNGQLAYDILSALEHDFPHCNGKINYILFEPLPNLAAAQKNKLSGFSCVQWVRSMDEMESFQGIVLGNELLDAFPFHRLEHIDDQNKKYSKWVECCVDIKEDSLIWTRQPCSPSLSSGLPADAKGKVEVCLNAISWLEQISSVFKHGYFLFFDYGWTDEEYFQVERPEGTLRGYSNHRQVDHILKHPGDQDITAHVRWSPFISKAAQLGFQVDEFIQQSRWLTHLVLQNDLEFLPHEARQFNTLTHPDMMGTIYRTLVLKKKQEGTGKGGRSLVNIS